MEIKMEIELTVAQAKRLEELNNEYNQVNGTNRSAEERLARHVAVSVDVDKTLDNMEFLLKLIKSETE